MTDPADAEALAVGRALSSPLRLRILRVCLHEAHTNKEIAQRLGISAAACHHHVRTLVDVGMLAPEEERRGRRGAREVPYRATGRSWDAPGDVHTFHHLLQTFLAEVAETPPGEMRAARLGLKLDPAHLEEFRDRMDALLSEFVARGPDADGTAISVFVAEHPDPNAGPPDARGDADDPQAGPERT